MRLAVLCLALPVLALPVARPASAAWPNSPFTNLPVCTAPNSQDFPLIVSDGSAPAGGVSGAIIVWTDNRGATDYDVYAQHVLASGAVDPAWPTNGRALCTAAGIQNELDVVSDGAGGAIVAWKDLRNGTNYDIYAQHVLASGAVDPAWPANGRALCTAAPSEYNPRIVTDGSGGAIVAWFESRGATSNDLYAQHVLASGLVDPAWPVDGRAVCTAPGLQSYPQMVSDGAAGAILAWRDNRGAGFDIYALRVLASGVVDPAWPVDGRALCTAANDQFSPQLVSDGASGAIVAWRDARSGSFYDIYAQHVLASGLADPAWPADGRAVCTAASYQQNPQLVADGSGGAIVAWEDERNGSTFDLYAQHLLASGAVDPAWPADGRAVCTAANDQSLPQLVSDGAAGAIVIWADHRDGTSDDVYAQHVTATGAVDPAWPADGRALSTAAGYQSYAHAVSDGAGGAIAAWSDSRSASASDVYAQRVARFGILGTPEPRIAAVADVPNDEGGKVKLSWDASWLDVAPSPVVTYYDLLRSVPPGVAAGLAAGAVLARPLKDLAQPLESGDLVAVADGAMAGYWEYLASVAALHYVSGYSYVAPTTGDSLPGSNPETAFMVVARDGSGAMYWPSAPASGWSVDDLAPAAPAPFTGQYAGGATAAALGPERRGGPRRLPPLPRHEHVVHARAGEPGGRARGHRLLRPGRAARLLQADGGGRARERVGAGRARLLGNAGRGGRGAAGGGARFAVAEPGARGHDAPLDAAADRPGPARDPRPRGAPGARAGERRAGGRREHRGVGPDRRRRERGAGGALLRAARGRGRRQDARRGGHAVTARSAPTAAPRGAAVAGARVPRTSGTTRARAGPSARARRDDVVRDVVREIVRSLAQAVILKSIFTSSRSRSSILNSSAGCRFMPPATHVSGICWMRMLKIVTVSL